MCSLYRGGAEPAASVARARAHPHLLVAEQLVERLLKRLEHRLRGRRVGVGDTRSHVAATRATDSLPREERDPSRRRFASSFAARARREGLSAPREACALGVARTMRAGVRAAVSRRAPGNKNALQRRETPASPFRFAARLSTVESSAKYGAPERSSAGGCLQAAAMARLPSRAHSIEPRVVHFSASRIAFSPRVHVTIGSNVERAEVASRAVPARGRARPTRLPHARDNRADAACVEGSPDRPATQRLLRDRDPRGRARLLTHARA